jgi:hypothetical protein
MRHSRWMIPTPLAICTLALGSLGTTAEAALDLSYQTTAGGTLSSGTTAGGVSVTGAGTTISGPASFGYFDTFMTPTSLIGSTGFGFYDDYMFTIATSQVASVTTTINLGSALQVSNLSVRLFDTASYDLQGAGGAPSLTPITGEIDATTSGSLATLTAIGLGAGTYVLEIRGVASGTSGGTYSGVLDVVPVPLPAGLPLLITGLGALGTMVRRARHAQLV